MIRTQEQSFDGQVNQYLVNREGDVDGLLLSNGIQVLFPPHLGTELTAIIQPNASVVIQGQFEGTNVIRAFAITNQSTGQTVVDSGPPVPPSAPPPPHGPAPQPGFLHLGPAHHPIHHPAAPHHSRYGRCIEATAMVPISQATTYNSLVSATTAK